MIAINIPIYNVLSVIFLDTPISSEVVRRTSLFPGIVMFWLGLFVGGFAGVICMALVSAGRDDNDLY